jgi:hypothetical protein
MKTEFDVKFDKKGMTLKKCRTIFFELKFTKVWNLNWKYFIEPRWKFQQGMGGVDDFNK